MGAPILWAPGIFPFFLEEILHVHKIPRLRGRGVFWAFGGGECRFYLYGRGDFSVTPVCSTVHSHRTYNQGVSCMHLGMSGAFLNMFVRVYVLFRSLRNDNKIARRYNFALLKFYCRGASLRKTAFSKFSSVPPMPPSPLKNANFIGVYCRLAVSNCCAFLRVYPFSARFCLPKFGRRAKPGSFTTRGLSLCFGKGPDCVADPFGTVPRRCCLIGRERGKGQIGKIPGDPRTNRENPGKIGKVPK